MTDDTTANGGDSEAVSRPLESWLEYLRRVAPAGLEIDDVDDSGLLPLDEPAAELDALAVADRQRPGPHRDGRDRRPTETGLELFRRIAPEGLEVDDLDDLDEEVRRFRREQRSVPKAAEFGDDDLNDSDEVE